MHRILVVAAVALFASSGTLLASGADYEGSWTTEPTDCQGRGNFLAKGRTLIVEAGRLRSRSLECEIRNVIGTNRDRMDMSCREPGLREHRRVLRIDADRRKLVIGGVGGEGVVVYHRCGRTHVAQRGSRSRAAAIRLEEQGERLLNSGDYARAEGMFTKSVQADPDYAHAFNNRGFAKRLQKRYADAIYDYDEALRLQPGTAVYHSNRGVAYDALDKLQMALADFDKAIEFDPNAPTALNGRGSVLRQLGKLDKAIVDLEMAVRIDPSYTVALNNLAMAYRDKGDRTRAVSFFDKALAIEAAQ